MLVAAWYGSLLPWEQELAAFKARLNLAFGRAELRFAAALDAGAPWAFVLANALYGADSRIRRMLEARQQALRASLTLADALPPRGLGAARRR